MSLCVLRLAELLNFVCVCTVHRAPCSVCTHKGSAGETGEWVAVGFLCFPNFSRNYSDWEWELSRLDRFSHESGFLRYSSLHRRQDLQLKEEAVQAAGETHETTTSMHNHFFDRFPTSNLNKMPVLEQWKESGVHGECTDRIRMFRTEKSGQLSFKHHTVTYHEARMLTTVPPWHLFFFLLTKIWKLITNNLSPWWCTWFLVWPFLA